MKDSNYLILDSKIYGRSKSFSVKSFFLFYYMYVCMYILSTDDLTSLQVYVYVYICVYARCSLVGEDSSEVQIKNTRFKKVSHFLSFCTSDECGRLLSTREENGVTMIASVQRAHELFKGAKVNDPEAFKAAVLSK